MLRPTVFWRSSLIPIYTAVAKLFLLPAGKTGFVDEDINEITISQVKVTPFRTNGSGSQALLAWIKNPVNGCAHISIRILCSHLKPSTSKIPLLIFPINLILLLWSLFSSVVPSTSSWGKLKAQESSLTPGLLLFSPDLFSSSNSSYLWCLLYGMDSNPPTFLLFIVFPTFPWSLLCWRPHPWCPHLYHHQSIPHSISR